MDQSKISIYFVTLVLILNLNPSTVAAVCPDHWTRYEDTCYFHDMTLVTFKDASEICNSFNATLASVHSLRQNNWISRFVSEQYTWLGAISNLEDSDKSRNKSEASSPSATVTNSSALNLKNSTHVPQVSITVTRVADFRSNGRKWVWIDGSAFNYWIWSRGDWFGMIPRQPDCNATCCTIFMNELGSWVDEDCNDQRRLASTLCTLRYSAISSKTSVEYETESQQTISSEVSMIGKIIKYIEGNFVTRNLLDERSNELVERTEVNKKELLDETVRTWIIPFVIILLLLVALLIISNCYLFYHLRKVHHFSNIKIGKFNFKTLNNRINEDSITVNEDV